MLEPLLDGQPFNTYYRRLCEGPVQMQKLHVMSAFLVLAGAIVCCPSADAQRRFGSNLARVPNVGFGCETAPILDPIFGTPIFAATGQTSCTFRSLGFSHSIEYSGRFSSVLPAVLWYWP